MRRLRTAVRKAWYSAMSASPPPSPRQSSLPKLAMPKLAMYDRRGRRLQILAQQLRHYRPSDPDEPVLDDREKVSSTTVLPDSSASDDIRRPTPASVRAAVLVCIFEGDCGDLRVILTKRSSNLSTHSGLFSLRNPSIWIGQFSIFCRKRCDFWGQFWLSFQERCRFQEGRQRSLTPTTGRRRWGRPKKRSVWIPPSSPSSQILNPSCLRYKQSTSIWIESTPLPPNPLICDRHFQHLLRVAPIVGILPDKQSFVPLLNASEVDEMFDAPLEMFLKVLLLFHRHRS